MSTAGQRKAALYLASLPAKEQRALLGALPADSVRALRPLIDKVSANGWNTSELVERTLASEIRGLTLGSSLTIEDFLTLTRLLPPDWIARLFVASTAIDRKFLLSLLDLPVAKKVRAHLDEVKELPSKLREALLAEASELAASKA